MTVVFTIPIGELSVALVPRPTVPNTRSTSGNCAQHPVLHLEQPRRLRDRQPRRRRRHVQHRPFVERRHELAADQEEQRDRQRDDGEVDAAAPPIASGAPARSTGAYSAAKNRETGFCDSGFRLRPRMKHAHQHRHERDRQERRPRTIANVFVNASGRNIRPSCASSRNTGMNETMMIASEKKIGRPTCSRPR